MFRHCQYSKYVRDIREMTLNRKASIHDNPTYLSPFPLPKSQTHPPSNQYANKQTAIAIVIRKNRETSPKQTLRLFFTTRDAPQSHESRSSDQMAYTRFPQPCAGRRTTAPTRSAGSGLRLPNSSTGLRLCRARGTDGRVGFGRRR